MKPTFARSALLAAVAIAGCAAPTRPERPLAELMSARQADDAARAQEASELLGAFLKRAEAKLAAKGPRGTPPTIDLLIISGGGDWGAFGAGVLKGWGRVSGELARPQFDVVTGVSTGPMTAPLAFAGRRESKQRVGRLR